MIFDPEEGGITFLRNVCSLTEYTVLYPRRWQHSETGRDREGPSMIKFRVGFQVLEVAVKKFSVFWYSHGTDCTAQYPRRPYQLYLWFYKNI
jgi:hypothetical protein